jgi:hypothetical protein
MTIYRLLSRSALLKTERVRRFLCAVEERRPGHSDSQGSVRITPGPVIDRCRPRGRSTTHSFVSRAADGVRRRSRLGGLLN